MTHMAQSKEPWGGLLGKFTKQTILDALKGEGTYGCCLTLFRIPDLLPLRTSCNGKGIKNLA